MSHSSGYRAGCANYQTCHLKTSRILDNSSSSCASARNVFSPRCLEMDNRTCQSARTSLNVDEESLYSRRDDIEPILSGCRSQASGTYFTKYLELKLVKIQEQHQKALSENMQLNNQLSRANVRNRQLEEKTATLEDALMREKHQRDSSYQQPSKMAMLTQGINATSTHEDSSTSSEYLACNYSEIAVQTSSDPAILPLDLVFISKTELASLENDIKTLRDAARAKEEMWEQAMERERNYREHWARLSRELITVRQQLDSRETEFKNLERKFTAQVDELRTAQKELSSTKKQLQKNQRDSGRSNQASATSNNSEVRETQHLKGTETKHESPRQSPTSRFRSNKMSPTKNVRTLL